MDSWVVPAAIGIAVAIAFVITNVQRRKKNASLYPTIVQYLHAKDMTLPDLVEAMGMTGLVDRGKVAIALNELVTEGKVSTIPPPPGTPQTKKIHSIRYRLERS